MIPKTAFIFVILSFLSHYVKGVSIHSENYVICPTQCVCQHAFLMDLPVARWITNQHNQQQSDTATQPTEKGLLFNNNEATYDGDDESHQNNPFVKFTMCMIQARDNLRDKIMELPDEVQVLVLIYSEESVNVTIYSSDFLVLTELKVLEIRGILSHAIRLVIDEELPTLQFANFESIRVEGTELLRRPQSSKQPFHNFDYKPYRERVGLINISMEQEDGSEEMVIVPYEVYLLEKKKSKIATFYGWTNLLVLRMHNCMLDEINWEMFDGLKNLQHLSLEHNAIKVVPPFAFYGAMNIKTLSLARNEILDLNYRSLAGLLELQRLDLSWNKLSKLSDVTFPPFPKLDTVDFRHNPIGNIYAETFGVMNSTKRIYLGDSSIALDLSEKDSESVFNYLNRLTHLTVTNVSIPVLDQSIFKGLKMLEVLKLMGTINRVEFDAFSDLLNLRELYLSHCQIKEISMDSFYGTGNLKIIDLSFNKISIIPPGIFDDQPYLKEIYLQNNTLSKLPTSFFDKTSYKLVRLNENPWYCTCAMTTWKQGVTNRIRSIKDKQKCIRDLTSNQIISCKIDDEYQFDNKVVPRCAGGPSNALNRSVYYALRKDLNCKRNHKTTMKQNYAFNKKMGLSPPLTKHLLMEQLFESGRHKFPKDLPTKTNHTIQYQKKVEKKRQHNTLRFQLANKSKSTKVSHHDMENDL